MSPRALQSDSEYQAALDSMESLWESPEGSAEERELEMVLMQIENYELQHYPVAVPVRYTNNLKRYRLTANAGGRRVLPIRALPYLDGWGMTPESVAKIMARKIDRANDLEFQRLAAYKPADDRFIRITTAEWESIYANFEAHSADVAKSILGSDKRLEIYQAEAIFLLPASSFFWADDFINEFSKPVDDFGPEFTDPVTALRSLVSCPISDDQAKIIFEGFDFPSSKAGVTAVTTRANGEKDQALANKIRKLAIDYLQQWRDAGHEPTKQDVALYIEGELSGQSYTGAKGRLLDRAYLERHFLKGITGHTPGYKSKLPKIPQSERGKLPTTK
jgi:hypothetical protein